MNLTDYGHSDKAEQNHINNEMSPVMVARAAKFLLSLVGPLEALFEPRKIVFHSGYRCEALNTLVKGRPNSQHVKANALDFHVEGMTLPDAYRVIKNSSLWYDQAIIEGQPGHQWVHCSYNTDKADADQRKQALEDSNA